MYQVFYTKTADRPEQNWRKTMPIPNREVAATMANRIIKAGFKAVIRDA